jgi:hypothetical protein
VDFCDLQDRGSYDYLFSGFRHFRNLSPGSGHSGDVAPSDNMGLVGSQKSTILPANMGAFW